MARKRERWKRHQNKLDPSRLVFIDETWAKCKAMPHEAMAKDATCARIAKDYPHAGKATKDLKPAPEKK